METLPDIRVEIQDQSISSYLLFRQWPSVPGRDSFQARAAVDCAVILLRAVWARLRITERPEPREDDDPFTRYVWAHFGGAQGKEAQRQLDAMAEQAVSYVSESMKFNPKVTLSFKRFCRDDVMVTALWGQTAYHRTYPVVLQGPRYPEGEVVKDGDRISRTSDLNWDGVSPSTLTELVNYKTGQAVPHDPNYRVFEYFNSPSVLQVNFTPHIKSRQSLADIWKVEADSYEPIVVDKAKGLGRYQKKGTQWYTMMAIVRRRGPPSLKADMIRLFREDGREQLPEAAISHCMPDWGFGLEEEVPYGESLVLFYLAIPCPVEIRPAAAKESVNEIPRSLNDTVFEFLEKDKKARE